MFQDPRVRDRWKAFALCLAIIIGVVALMQTVTSTGMISAFLLPSPWQIVMSFPVLFGEEGLLPRLGITAIEVFSAASLAIIIGGFIGWGLYRSRNAWLAFNGWVAALNAAPLILLYPLLLVIFGRGNQTVIVLGVLGGLPPIVLKTHEAFEGVRPVLRYVAKSFNLSPARQFWVVELPAAAPTMMAGVRLGSFYSVISVVGAEFLTGVGGVGALIPDLADRFQIAAMYGTIVFVILTSVAFMAVVRRLEKWFRPA